MAKSETLTRYQIEHVHQAEGRDWVSRMNVLLDNDTLKAGDKVSLEEMDDIIWTVIERHETLKRHSVKRGWNNNI